MTQKHATPTRQQQDVIQKAGLQTYLWTVIKELNYSMIIRHRVTGEVKLIQKEENQK